MEKGQEMGKRLIDANEFNAILQNAKQRSDIELFKEIAEMICGAIDEMPTVDAVELPCKIGQTVWFVRDKRHIEETFVEKIILKSGGLYIKLASNAMYETSCRSIGKTVFFTKEEAEKAWRKEKR